MRKSGIYFSLLACFSVVFLLAACGEASSGARYEQHILQAPTTIPSASLGQVDWRNFTYTFPCSSDQPVTITLHNGSAQQNGVSYSVHRPVFGDLTGNGRMVAVIIFQCVAADAAPAQVFVYAGTVRHPSLLATLPPDEHAHVSVRSASIARGILQLTGDGYARNDAHCCPSLKVVTRYKLNGAHFDVLNAEASPLATPKP